MADDVTDLTEDGEESNSDGGKQKKVKPPKEPKAKKEKVPKEKGEKKGGGGAGIIIVMLLVLVILIGGFGAALYFDVFSARTIIGDVVRDPLLSVIIWLDPRFSTVDQQMAAERETQERRFFERTADLDIREEEVVLLETALNTREQNLLRREADLDRREQEILAMIDRTIPHFRRDLTDEVLEEMESYARTYAQMSPSDAAQIMVEIYDQRDVAGILFFMQERPRAAIMAVMDARYAAGITEIWLYN